MKAMAAEAAREAVEQIVREIARPRCGEKRIGAIHRVSAEIGLSPRKVRRLVYGEPRWKIDAAEDVRRRARAALRRHLLAEVERLSSELDAALDRLAMLDREDEA